MYPRNMVCFRYIIVSALYTGDNKDDDDDDDDDNNNNNNNKGATGAISKSFRKYVSNIPGNH